VTIEVAIGEGPEPGNENGHPRRLDHFVFKQKTLRGQDVVWVPAPEVAQAHGGFYAPNITNADTGGKPFSEYPFVLSMSPGRDDVIILFAGEAEKAKNPRGLKRFVD
jgi:hypothetical protein